MNPCHPNLNRPRKPVYLVRTAKGYFCAESDSEAAWRFTYSREDATRWSTHEGAAGTAREFGGEVEEVLF